MGALALKVQSGHSAQTRMRILVLDDDAFDRKRVRRWVERTYGVSAQLSEAANLTHFSDQIASHAFDLVMLDYGLADGDGLDAVRMMREHPKNADAFAVMISGRDDDGLRNKCLSEGCDQFVSKSALDASKIHDILEEVQERNMQPTLLETATQTSALAFWSARAELRSKRAQRVDREDNLTVLSELLGIDLPETPSPKAEIDYNAAVLDAPVSMALRGFITDFLACDEFEFMPSSVEMANAKQDLDQ